MAALVATIHEKGTFAPKRIFSRYRAFVDARDEPGNDDGG